MLRNVVIMFRARLHPYIGRVLWPGWQHVVRYTGMPGVSVSYKCSCGWHAGP